MTMFSGIVMMLFIISFYSLVAFFLTKWASHKIFKKKLSLEQIFVILAYVAALFLLAQSVYYNKLGTGIFPLLIVVCISLQRYRKKM